MSNTEMRMERDSMGEVQVPAWALYGAQTQRAVDNFPISGIRFSRMFIRALGLIKGAAAAVNVELGLLDQHKADAIRQAADEVAAGQWDEHFPIDIFQTGSGTSTNMNANEVIANRAIQVQGGEIGSKAIHPNDHVNLGQSSNDVIPTAIHVATYLAIHEELLPALAHLESALRARASELQDVVKTGRTHLMDAMPVTMGHELGGYAAQINQARVRIESSLAEIAALAIGGTAVGTGINTHPEFGARMAAALADTTGMPFIEAANHFAAQAAMDGAVAVSGQLKILGVALSKIANDLRLMNSGPQAGMQEITLPALQPGSSIMPSKINPVIPEAVLQVCAQVVGNDATVTLAGQGGVFELNVALPVLAHNLLESITLLANASRVLADKAVAGFTVNREHIESLVELNPILATALNPVIGYDRAAQIAKQALAEQRTVREVAREQGLLSDEELDRVLDPRAMTEGGFAGGRVAE